MKVYGYIRNGESEEVKKGIQELSDKVYYSLGEILKDIDNFEYGNILLQSAASRWDNETVIKLRKAGLVFRLYKGKDTNLDDINLYNKILRNYIDLHKDGTKHSLTVMCGGKCSRLYINLGNYTKVLLEIYNKELYIEFNKLQRSKKGNAFRYSRKSSLEVENTYINILNSFLDINNKKPLYELCRDKGVSSSGLYSFIGNKLEIVDNRLYKMYKAKTNRTKSYDLSVKLKIIDEYINSDVLTVNLEDITSKYGINSRVLSTFANRELKSIDTNLYVKYLERAKKSVNSNKLAKTSIETKLNVIREFVNSNKSFNSVCEEYGVNNEVIFSFISMRLKDVDIDLYNAYKHKQINGKNWLKDKILKEWKETGNSLKSICDNYGISYTTIYKYKKKQNI